MSVSSMSVSSLDNRIYSKVFFNRMLRIVRKSFFISLCACLRNLLIFLTCIFFFKYALYEVLPGLCEHTSAAFWFIISNHAWDSFSFVLYPQNYFQTKSVHWLLSFVNMWFRSSTGGTFYSRSLSKGDAWLINSTSSSSPIRKTLCCFPQH